MTLVLPNSAYADPEAAFTAPVLKTAREDDFSSMKIMMFQYKSSRKI